MSADDIDISNTTPVLADESEVVTSGKLMEVIHDPNDRLAASEATSSSITEAI